MTSPEPKRSDHLPALDGLRGLAIALVLVHHFLLVPGARAPSLVRHVLEAGWAGVDVFFAISGFLITGILLRSRGEESWWRGFYVRRALRILPLYWLVTTVVLLTAPASSEKPPAYVAYGFLYNFWVAHQPYVAGQRIDVSWSLCVEEHFYLVWPFVVRFLPERRMPIALGAIVAGAIAARANALASGALVGVYVLTYCRMDALAIGASAAVIWHVRDERWLSLARVLALPLSLLALALMVGGLFDRESRAFATAGYLLVPLATACTILGLVNGHFRGVSALLSRAPLAPLGKISYGVYLLHPLVAQLVAFGAVALGVGVEWASRTVAGGIVSGVMTIAFATLTWRTIEQPFLKLKERFARRTPAI